MPLENIYSENPDQLIFTWKSFRFFYSLIITMFLFLQVTCVTAWTFSKKIEFGKIVPLIMHLTNFGVVFYFFKLATKWPKLMKRWFEIEMKLPKFTKLTNKPNLSIKIKLLTVVIMTLTLSKLTVIFMYDAINYIFYFLVNYILDILVDLFSSYNCPAIKNRFKAYWVRSYPQYSFITGFNMVFAIWAMFVDVASDFIYNYSDLFVILISVGLSTRFKQIADELMLNKGRVLNDKYLYE